MTALLDTLGMFDAAAGLPEQVDDAARPRPRPSPTEAACPPTTTIEHVVVLGMGGSGIAGDVATAVAGPFMAVPVVVHKGYGLPNFVDRHTLVFAVSFSGDTEETVEAASRGRGRRGVAGGGRPAAASWATWPGAGTPPRRAGGRRHPRAPGRARGPGRPAAGRARAHRAVPGRPRLDRRGRRPSCGAGATSSWPRTTRPTRLARRIGRQIPIVYGGGGIGAVAARRWKTQFNENAKVAGLQQRACPSCATTRSAAGARTAT